MPQGACVGQTFFSALGRVSITLAGLESPANRQAEKPAPHCLARIPGPQLQNSG
jgi:hypothetical protein